MENSADQLIMLVLFFGVGLKGGVPLSLKVLKNKIKNVLQVSKHLVSVPCVYVSELGTC